MKLNPAGHSTEAERKFFGDPEKWDRFFSKMVVYVSENYTKQPLKVIILYVANRRQQYAFEHEQATNAASAQSYGTLHKPFEPGSANLFQTKSFSRCITRYHLGASNVRWKEGARHITRMFSDYETIKKEDPDNALPDGVAVTCSSDIPPKITNIMKIEKQPLHLFTIYNRELDKLDIPHTISHDFANHMSGIVNAFELKKKEQTTPYTAALCFAYLVAIICPYRSGNKSIAEIIFHGIMQNQKTPHSLPTTWDWQAHACLSFDQFEGVIQAFNRPHAPSTSLAELGAHRADTANVGAEAGSDKINDERLIGSRHDSEKNQKEYDSKFALAICQPHR